MQVYGIQGKADSNHIAHIRPPVFGIVPDLETVGSDIEAEGVPFIQNRFLEHFVGSWCGVTQEALKLQVADIRLAE